MYYMELKEPYLEHHGVLGQKKGVRNGPPYPLIRDTMGRLKTKVQEKRKAATAAKAAKEADDDTVRKERLKKNLREHPEKLYEHRDELSKQEVDEIVRLIQWDKSIKAVSEAAHVSNIGKLRKIVADTANFAENSWKIYNNGRNFYNAFQQIRKSAEKAKEK